MLPEIRRSQLPDNMFSSSLRDKEISIVVPVYYSEGCLEELARQVSTAVPVDHELILVDDGSRDNSWKVIQGLTRKYDNVVGIRLRRNYGQDNAIMAGLRKVRGNYVVIMDDDLQHSPADIMKLYEACGKEYDICYANFETFHHSQWKQLGSRFNGKMAEVLLGKPSEIYLSPFKIMNRDLVDEICNYSGPYPYVDGILLGLTSHITQIDLDHQDRFAGSSTYSVLQSLRVWLRHATGFSVAPLRFVSLGGAVVALLGFLLGIFYIAEYLFAGVDVPGWSSLVCAVLFLGGLNLMCIGVVGEYVGRNYMNVNKKPQYSIREVEGDEGS